MKGDPTSELDVGAELDKARIVSDAAHCPAAVVDIPAGVVRRATERSGRIAEHGMVPRVCGLSLNLHLEFA